MKLYYWDGNNFGDKLNPWLWSQLLPNYFNDDTEIAFLGIGTLINDTYIRIKKNLAIKLFLVLVLAMKINLLA